MHALAAISLFYGKEFRGGNYNTSNPNMKQQYVYIHTLLRKSNIRKSGIRSNNIYLMWFSASFFSLARLEIRY